MSLIYKIRSGKEEDLPILRLGEPGLCTDSKRVFIGTGNANIELANTDYVINKITELANSSQEIQEILDTLEDLKNQLGKDGDYIANIIKTVIEKVDWSTNVYTTEGTTNNYTLSIPNVTNYNQLTSKALSVIFHIASDSETININVNNLGDRHLYLYETIVPNAAAIKLNVLYTIYYNGTAFIISNGSDSEVENIIVNDTLTSTSTTEALSAAQGKILNDTKASLASPVFTGIPKAPTGADYTTSRIRNAYFSTSVPSTVSDGDICFVYE